MTELPVSDMEQENRISADSHVAEPFDLWETRLPKAFQDRALRFPKGKIGEVHHVRAGGWDPRERPKDMALDGVSAEVLYPTLALAVFRTRDPGLSQQCAAVYNDWMFEFCQEAPDRLWGQAVIPLWDAEYGVRELERSAKRGLCGATIWLVPPAELPFSSPHYDKFWAAAQDLDMPVSMHINATGGQAAGDGSSGARGGAGGERRPSSPAKNLVAAMNTLSDIIRSGTLERFPRLKIVVAEIGIAWVPVWLEVFDREYIEDTSDPLPLLPSEYFYRQVYATFLDDVVGGHLLPRFGASNFMWSNDYPHNKCIWPNSQETIARVLGHLPADVRSDVICHNVARLYNRDVPAPMAVPPEPADLGFRTRRWLPPS